MRLLVINPNSSQGVTDRIRAAAEAAALPDERVETIAAAGAPELIVTPEDQALATEAVLATVARHGDRADGIVLASFGDTGLAQVRARVRVPVTGIARSAYAAATALGDRFAVVSFSATMAPSLRHTIEDYGLAHRLAGLLTVAEARWSSPAAIQDELQSAMRQLCIEAAALPGVASVVLGGGPLAGLAARLQAEVPVPLIDGTTAAVAMLRLALSGTRAASPALSAGR